MNQIPRSPKTGAQRAFTLIELLAVIGILAVVIVFAVPAMNQILRGSQLTQGSQQIADQLNYARQVALSQNKSVEVRLYRFADPETPGEDVENPKTGQWRAFQLFTVMANGATAPLGEMKRLPRMVVMDGDKFSSLINEEFRGTPKKATDDPTAPELTVESNNQRVGKRYDFVSFRFLPDGSTDLPPRARRGGGGGANNNPDDDTWYITLIGLTESERHAEDITGINYFTIQIDPVSGTTKSYRPTAG